MTARPDQVDLTGLGARTRELADFAERGGAEAPWLEETHAQLLAVFRELEQRRAGYYDPRRRAALELGERISKAKDAGASIAQLSERFGRSPSRIYRLIDIFARHRATVLRFDRRRSTSTAGGG